MSEMTLAAYDNPFCAARLRPGTIDYIFSADNSLQNVVDTLRDNRWHGQIVGPHGTGKSTLLASITAELKHHGHIVHESVLHDGQRSLPGQLASRVREIPVCLNIEIIDGFEQLSLWNRWSLPRKCLRSGRGLIVTTHNSAGFKTVHETAIDRERAWRVVLRLQQGYAKLIDRADLSNALKRRQGNLREALFDLYDVYERRSKPFSPET